jgi:hypothetical protein
LDTNAIDNFKVAQTNVRLAARLDAIGDVEVAQNELEQL